MTTYRVLDCVCCGAPVDVRDPDPWNGRMDDYCWRCCSMRCDAYPVAHECPECNGAESVPFLSDGTYTQRPCPVCTEGEGA